MYPEEIDLPEAKDFCKDQMYFGVQSCFIGWKLMLLPDLTSFQSSRFYKIANEVAVEMKLKNTPRLGGSDISVINDHPENTKEQLADWFAKTIEKLGYDVS